MEPRSSPIAIVGIGGMFPGASDLESFWTNILENRCASAEIPESRLPRPIGEFYDPKVGRIDRVYSTRACLLDSVDPDFGPAFADSRVDPAWFAQLDPVFHLTTRVGLQAFRDARMDGVDRDRVGVILANIVLPTDTASQFTLRLFSRLSRGPGGAPALDEAADAATAAHDPADAIEAADIVGNPWNRYPAGLPAGLLAKILGLGGGSYTLDAACASSLYAIKYATDELRAGRLDAVLTGGVCRPECLYTQMGFSQLRALSPTGIPKPLDRGADGIVIGEGAGMFVLKRLGDALAQGDKIYGLVRAAGLSNDRRGSVLAPDSEGQIRALEAAYLEIGWDPASIDLIECHATGTQLGDRTEIESLRALWRNADARETNAVLGSVKSNIGHLLTAAGSASLMKVLFALRDARLPPSCNFDELPKGCASSDFPFRVLNEPEPWESAEDGRPRRAAVNAFGFGGINAHLLVEEWAGQEPAGSETSVAVPDREESANAPPAQPDSAPAVPPVPQPGGPVAVVGMAVVAGDATDLKAFQHRAFGASPCLGARSEDRWWNVDAEPWFGEMFPRMASLAGNYIGEVVADAAAFHLPPIELGEMLPQQLLMLEVSRRALADADLQDFDPVRAGAFIGIELDYNSTNYYLRWAGQEGPDAAESADDDDSGADPRVSHGANVGPPLTAGRTLGGLGGMVASRVARELTFGGPSFTVSSEDCSGLRALGVGLRSLQRGEIDCAVAGGVHLGGDVRSLLAADALRNFAPGETADAFSATTRGPLPGEAAVALVLKRLEDAERDGDRIYGVIRGFGATLGGEPQSAIASRNAYERALELAYAEAEIDPATIGYIETHGSGLAGEDLAESAALLDFFGRHSLADESGAASADGRAGFPESRTALGSAMPQFGHCGPAAGLVGLAKALLALYQEILPPGPVHAELTPALEDAADVFHVPRLPGPWLRNRTDGPRRAAVSAMSIDGNCMHVVLEAYEGPAAQENPRVRRERLNPLGNSKEILLWIEGRDEEALAKVLDDLESASAAAKDRDVSLSEFAHAWWRDHPQDETLALGASFLAASWNELERNRERLRELLGSGGAGEASAPHAFERIFFNPRPLADPGKTAFVYPGSGNHFLGMGSEIGARWPGVLRRLDEENEYLLRQFAPHRYAPWRLAWPEGWEEQALVDLIGDHRSLIIGHVSHATVMSDLLQSFGLRPEAVLGYSLGESAGYFATRAWRARDEMLRRMENSDLFSNQLAGSWEAARQEWGLGEGERADWRVGIVDRSAEEVKAALQQFERVYLLIVNTPGECVVGGQWRSLERLVEYLGCNFVPIDGVSTVHCRIALPLRDQYRGLHLFRCTPMAGVAYYSCGFGRTYEIGRQSAADSMVTQAIAGFDFPRVVEKAYEEGVRTFLEVGPQGSCTRMIGKILGDRPHIAYSASNASRSDMTALLTLLGQMIAERIPVDLSPLFDAADAEMESEPDSSVAPRRKLEIRLRTGGRFDAVLGEPEPEDGEAEETGAEGPDAGESRAKGGVEERGAPSVTSDEGAVDLEASVSVSDNNSAAPEQLDLPLFGRDHEMTLAIDRIQDAVVQARDAAAEAHETFLRASRLSFELQAKAAELQMEVLGAMEGKADIGATSPPVGPPPASIATPPSDVPPSDVPSLQAPTFLPPAEPPRYFSKEMCYEFARGSLGNVLGPRFAAVDAHPTRVRLPDDPLMLVDRILEVEGEPGRLGPARIVTEHIVKEDGWYLDGDRMVTGVTVEAGQADLFLSAYLGIDFHTKGIAKYRLLDAQVTFYRELPRPGETILYDIRIERFANQGDTRLFFFQFDATIDGEPLLSMRHGCAGFFTETQLDEGRGLVLHADDMKSSASATPLDRNEWVEQREESYDSNALDALRRGELAACFGPAFEGLPVSRVATIPSGALALIDRVTKYEPTGGHFGLGMIRSEKDIEPDAWFLTSHFIDDPVMPGTLMYESCLQTFRVMLMRLGWIAEQDEVRLGPIPGVGSFLRCRGQVIPGVRKATYEIHLKEIGYEPAAHALGDAIMYADGKPIVLVKDISIRFAGLTRDRLEHVWHSAQAESPPWQRPAPVARLVEDLERVGIPCPIKPAIFDRRRIEAYATGSLVEAFGDRYEVFDGERQIARLPGPPFLFVDRITDVEAAAWKIEPGGVAEAQFDVDPDAWFFAANRQSTLPFSVLLEYPLQVCGWLAAYMGSALTSESDMRFRNLDGEAILHRVPRRDVGMLTARVSLVDCSQSAGMVIQRFAFVVADAEGILYEGTTVFGFFSPQALASQLGVRGAKPYRPSVEEVERGRPVEIPSFAPRTPDDAAPEMPQGAALPSETFRMIDTVPLFVAQGGPHGLGFIRGTKRINPQEWFFDAHFYQDPVQPGSLGLEAFLQLLKVVALHRWGGESLEDFEFEPIASEIVHTWSYRGQVVRENKQVVVEAVVTKADDDNKLLVAEGFLKVDGLVIYSMENFGIRLVPVPRSSSHSVATSESALTEGGEQESR